MKRFLNVTAILGLTVSAHTAAMAQPSAPVAMRDLRYCEVFTVTGAPLRPRVSVYNTFPLNECPQEAWQTLLPDQLAADLGVEMVILNGPRYFIMDGVAAAGDTAVGETITVGDIGMIKRAEIDPGNINRSERPYTETAILRETSYQFDAGMPMFLLMAPNNVVYAMQSYSLQVDPELGYADLETLADRLSLPEGWSYRVAVPKTDYVASATGEARVIQDDLMNSYQKIGTLPASLVLQ